MGLIEWIGAILGGIAINLIACELFAWGPQFSNWLARWAVWRLPAEIQERLREEWAAHLNTLHPLSRTLTAIGFVLAAYRIRLSFDRDASGALTLREWLAPKPIVVVVMTDEAAVSMASKMSELLELKNIQSFHIGGVVRSNLMAKAQGAWCRMHKRMLLLRGKELQPTQHHHYARLSRTSFGGIALENDAAVLLFKIRRTTLR